MKTNQTATIQLPVSHEHGAPVFSDFLTEIQRRFDVEKDTKNELISFVCSKGLYREFEQWRKLDDDNSIDVRFQAFTMQVIN